MDARPRRHERGSCPGGALAARRRGPAPSRAPHREGGAHGSGCRASGAGRWRKRRPRRAAAVDPALVDRARTAAERRHRHAGPRLAGALQIRFDDEKGLEELVEGARSRAARESSRTARRDLCGLRPGFRCAQCRPGSRSPLASCRPRRFRPARRAPLRCGRMPPLGGVLLANKHGRSWTRTRGLRLIRAAL